MRKSGRKSKCMLKGVCQYILQKKIGLGFLEEVIRDSLRNSVGGERIFIVVG